MEENNDYEDSIALACIATTSIFGLISNGLALYMTRKMSRFRNAFGILCSSFLICNMQAIFVLFVWSVIVLTLQVSFFFLNNNRKLHLKSPLLSSPELKSPLLSSPELFLVRLIGVFVNGGWFGALFVHFFIALNRLCAVAYPIKYKKLWSEAKALVTGIISWTLGMTVCMIHLYKDCSLLFDTETYDFNYQDSFYGNICNFGDSGLAIIAIIAMISLDTVTLTKILAHRRTMSGRSATSSSVRNEREILFFKQSCILGLVFFICFAILAGHQYILTDKWLVFAASTITWIMMQSLDGLIFLIFNLKMLWKTICVVSAAPTTRDRRLIATKF
uniref:G_PROTEIN_RECEP_F1_2 domain-containing protein n=1 Tax=Onchocerca volvulus TaxID=6282 RepID=A0A8R1XRX3_ONCVO